MIIGFRGLDILGRQPIETCQCILFEDKHLIADPIAIEIVLDAVDIGRNLNVLGLDEVDHEHLVDGKLDFVLKLLDQLFFFVLLRLERLRIAIGAIIDHFHFGFDTLVSLLRIVQCGLNLGLRFLIRDHRGLEPAFAVR